MTSEEIRYREAEKEVKKIKGFYTHAIVYIVINCFIFIANVREVPAEESIFQWRTLSTPLFWGIGLLAHGLSVFMPNWILGKDWEERKIKEFMEKEKSMRQ